MLRFFTSIVLLALSLSLVAEASAGELKVLDQRGLVRAVRDVQSSATIHVQTSGPVEEVSLVNTDGLAAPLSPATPGGPELVFNGVGSGTWQLKASSPIAVKGIEIK